MEIISGNNKDVQVSSREVKISGNDNSATCLAETDSVTISGNDNHCVVHAGSRYVKISGNDNSIHTYGSSGQIKVSGNDNRVTIGADAGDLTLSGNDLKVVIAENCGQITISGNAMKVEVTGNVNSITMRGNNHTVRVGGSCLGNIQIGVTPGTFQTGKTRKNRVTIGGSVQNLTICGRSYRNEIECERIETVELDGTENRVKCLHYENLIDNGTGNLIGASVDLDAQYNTSDSDSDEGDTIFNNGNGINSNTFINYGIVQF